MKHQTIFIFQNKFLKNMLILSKLKNSHYFLIKDFNRFMANKTKHREKSIFVNIVYNAFLAK